MHSIYVNSNKAPKTPHYAAPVQAESQRTSPVLSQIELRAIVLQMVG